MMMMLRLSYTQLRGAVFMRMSVTIPLQRGQQTVKGDDMCHNVSRVDAWVGWVG